MTWNFSLIFIFVLGVIFFATVLLSLSWSMKKGQFKHFDDQAKSIFDESEPEGVRTDFFPDNTKQKQDI